MLTTPRNLQIKTLRAEGKTLRAIGDQFGLTRERIRQIVSDPARRQQIVPSKSDPRRPTRDKVYAFILSYMTEHHGLPPALTEIMEAVGIASTSTVVFHLRNLAAEGRIVYHPDLYISARNFYLPGATWTPPTQGTSDV